jgi:hypothetical protein
VLTIWRRDELSRFAGDRESESKGRDWIRLLTRCRRMNLPPLLETERVRTRAEAKSDCLPDGGRMSLPAFLARVRAWAGSGFCLKTEDK